MEKSKNLAANGRELVSLVRIYPRSAYAPKIDFSDYENKDIWAVIPCWKSSDGTLTSVKTGATVKVSPHDEIRHESWGTAFDFPDGEKIIYTRYWEKGRPYYKFIPRECRECECIVIRARGEELTAAPRR